MHPNNPEASEPIESAQGSASPAAADMLRVFRQVRHIMKPGQPVAGLNPSEFMLLFGVRRCAPPNGIKVTDLSARMRVASPTVTQLVNALEAKGLLERSKDESDGRVIRIKMTPGGLCIVTQVEEEILTGMQDLIEHMGPDRSRMLIELLDEAFQFFESRPTAWRADSSLSNSPKEGD